MGVCVAEVVVMSYRLGTVSSDSYEVGDGHNNVIEQSNFGFKAEERFLPCLSWSGRVSILSYPEGESRYDLIGSSEATVGTLVIYS